MSADGLRALGGDRFVISGPMGFDNAATLLEQSESLFGNAGSVEIDLSAVTKVDSAGLALLIEWLRQARQRGQKIRFKGMPSRLNALAKLSGVADFMG